MACIMLAVSFSAVADRDDWRPREGWHRDWRFRGPDMDRWRGGYWIHGDHDGHLGWWWIVAGTWYFYPRPVYPYPVYSEPDAPPYYVPAQPELPAPPPVQYWYYCNAAKAYYPYVQTCPGGWARVPATPAAPNQ